MRWTGSVQNRAAASRSVPPSRASPARYPSPPSVVQIAATMAAMLAAIESFSSSVQDGSHSTVKMIAANGVYVNLSPSPGQSYSGAATPELYVGATCATTFPPSRYTCRSAGLSQRSIGWVMMNTQ